MSVYAYRVFKAIHQEGSFAKAASILGLTPSAVSHIIAELEKGMGLSLFTRNRKGVGLTGDGEALLPYIMDLLSSHEHLEQQIAHVHGLESGVVRIGAYGSVAVQWLPEITRRFREEHPNISFQVYQGGTDDILEKFRARQIDVAFVSRAVYTGKLPQGAVVEPLYRDPLLCVTPRDFRPRNGSYVTIDELKDFPFILQREGYDPGVKAILDRYHLTVSSEFSVTDDNYATAMVSSGFGIAILPELVIKGCAGSFSSYPIMPEQYRSIDLVVDAEPRQSPITRILRGQVRKMLREIC